MIVKPIVGCWKQLIRTCRLLELPTLMGTNLDLLGLTIFRTARSLSGSEPLSSASKLWLLKRVILADCALRTTCRHTLAAYSLLVPVTCDLLVLNLYGLKSWEATMLQAIRTPPCITPLLRQTRAVACQHAQLHAPAWQASARRAPGN